VGTCLVVVVLGLLLVMYFKMSPSIVSTVSWLFRWPSLLSSDGFLLCEAALNIKGLSSTVWLVLGEV